jgi:hypothetical protein
MTSADRTTLRAVCEAAVSRSSSAPSPPIITLPVSMVLGLLDAATQTPTPGTGEVSRAHGVSSRSTAPATDLAERGRRLFGRRGA